MRGTAGDVEIDRQQGSTAIVDLGVVHVGTAANGAGAHGDDQLGGWDRRIRIKQRYAHVLADRASNDDSIRVSGGGDELDSEATQIENDCPQYIELSFARIAATGAHLA